MKAAYLIWFSYYQVLPKTHRHSLGYRIDIIFITIIETIAAASFLPRHEKIPYVQAAIRKTDTLKILLMVLWEAKSLDNKKYLTLSQPIDEIGRMLGGWLGQLNKNSPP